MHMVKIRRVGNSNVITLPQQLEAAGYTSGASVFIEQTDSGDLLILPEDRLEERNNETGRRVIEENREALEMLAAYDRDEITADGVEIASERAHGSVAST